MSSNQPGSSNELHKLEWYFYAKALFCELYSDFHYKLFVIFFQNDGNFYQMILSDTLGRDQSILCASTTAESRAKIWYYKLHYE